MSCGVKLWLRLTKRKTKLKQHKDGRLYAELEHVDHDQTDKMQGWLPKNHKWMKLFRTTLNTPEEPEVGNYDDLVRHLITESSEDYGWSPEYSLPKIKTFGSGNKVRAMVPIR